MQRQTTSPDRRSRNALAAGRSVDAALRARVKRRKEQTAAQAPAQRPDDRASTAHSTTQRLEPLAALSP
jgi:hypothetical protein